MRWLDRRIAAPGPHLALCLTAAAELRRLHAENEVLNAQKAELLEALQTVMGDANHGQHMSWEDRCKQARAAIAKAEANK